MSKIIENFFNLASLERSLVLLRSGLYFTVTLTVAAFLLALIVGAFVAWGRMNKKKSVQAIASAYTDVMRATPPLVTLVIIYYVLPALVGGLSLAAYEAAVVTFGLIHAAYVGEIYRGGIIAISPDQIDAARSLGLTDAQSARFVIAPQLVRIVVPPLTSQATQIVRDASLAFVIGYPELLTMAKAAQRLTANSTPIVAAAIMYMVLLLGLQIYSAWIEKHNQIRTGR